MAHQICCLTLSILLIATGVSGINPAQDEEAFIGWRGESYDPELSAANNNEPAAQVAQ
jgi:hypothetical protein